MINIKNQLFVVCVVCFCIHHTTSIAQDNRSNTQVYGDLSYYYTDETDDIWSSSIDLFTAYRLDQSNTFLLEVHAERRTDHESHFEGERWWWKHQLSDHLAFSLGRFHAPLGQWNKSFHHGIYLQDTIDRPFYLNFEHDNGFMPAHSVGFNLEGDSYFIGSVVYYKFFITNNQKLQLEHQENQHDNHAHEFHVELIPQDEVFFDDELLIGFNINITNEQRPYEYGLYFSQQTITGDRFEHHHEEIIHDVQLYDQRIFGIDFKVRWNKLDVLSEIHYLTIEDKHDGSNHDSMGGYLQFGYNLSDRSKGTIRASFLSYDDNDSFYQVLNIRERSRLALAYRYELTPKTTVKIQWSRSFFQDDLEDLDNELGLQFAFYY